jgi:fatty acid/phospholipid biosynthesis enzyme
VIAHGSSGALAIRNAIERAQEAVAAALRQTCELDVVVDVSFEELR